MYLIIDRDSLGRFITSKKHKARDDPLTYNSWNNMMRRCYVVTNNRYKYYGELGVKVCIEWHDYDIFYKDMGPRIPGHTLDRINVFGDYCKENCKWSTKIEQANNKKDNIFIEYLGKIQTLKQWCDELNLPYKTIFSRYKYSKILDYSQLFSRINFKTGSNLK